MLIFHISDLHIGKILQGYNLKEDQEYVLGKIVEKAAVMKPQAVMLAGDIYDKSVPSSEAVNIFDSFLTSLSKAIPSAAIMVIGGNHDGAERLQFAQRILERQNIYIEGLGPMEESQHIRNITLEDEYGEVEFYLLPYIKPGHVRKLFEEVPQSHDEAVKKLIEREKIDFSKRNVIVSHQFYTAHGKDTERSDSEMVTVGGIDNVNAAVLEDFDYAALGHIHKKQCVGSDHIVYSGSILKYSVSEQNQEKGFHAVTLRKKGEVSKEFIELRPLRDVREIRGSLEEVMCATGNICEDYVSIVLTDEIDLYRPKDRLEKLYKNILDIRLDNERVKERMMETKPESRLSTPMETFGQFFMLMQNRELKEAEQELISGVINTAKEQQ